MCHLYELETRLLIFGTKKNRRLRWINLISNEMVTIFFSLFFVTAQFALWQELIGLIKKYWPTW